MHNITKSPRKETTFGKQLNRTEKETIKLQMTKKFWNTKFNQNKLKGALSD